MKVLLSKIPPVSVEYAFLRPGDGFHLHCPVMTLSLCAPHGGQPLRIAVCSTHLIACPWLMEGRRKRELAHLASTMPESVDACVVMGDFNFHREAENASIPEGWAELPAAAPLYKYGATFDGSLSWTGKTLVLSGVDLSAIDRGEYGTVVWKSTDDGETFSDETGDLVTVSPGPGVWYESDFYFVTRGAGVMVKRNFDGAAVVEPAARERRRDGAAGARGARVSPRRWPGGSRW